MNAATEDKHSITAAVALKSKRLTLSWLDGETQKVRLYYYCDDDDDDDVKICLSHCILRKFEI